MKTILATLITAATMAAATPTQADLESSLEFARAAWGAPAHGPISVIVDTTMNACKMGAHDLTAVTMEHWEERPEGFATSTIRFEGDDLPQEGEPEPEAPVFHATRTRRYEIHINGNCEWGTSLLSLDTVMLHEFGHVLLGVSNEVHSKNPRSVMFWIVRGSGQSILAEDRAKLPGMVAAK